MSINRIQAEKIIGARIFICRIGDEVTADGTTTTISDSFVPDAPTSYAQPGCWVPLGKIREVKIQTDKKSADVEGVDDSGTYKVTEMNLVTKRKLQFSTNDIAPEAYELTFGLLSKGTAGQEQPLWASGNDTIEVWLHLELTDAYAAETGQASATMRGKLTLQNPLEAKSDPALAEYELAVVPNALSGYTPTEAVL